MWRDRARAELSGTATDIAGIVTMGLLPSTCELLAGPLMTAVARDHPRIRMRMAVAYMETLQQWLEMGDIDTALLYGIAGRCLRHCQCDVAVRG